MNTRNHRYPAFIILLLFIISGLSPLHAQQHKQYESVKDALQSGSKLSGAGGPGNINWIDEGDRYSYMQYNAEAKAREIRAYNPDTGNDELIFNSTEYTFPGSDKDFEYQSFQWSKDSKYIVFQSNFRPVYRRSGISDYYLYSTEGDSLSLLAKDARTAELSPDGTKIGYERDGDLFVYDIESKTETQLTDSGKKYFYTGRFGWVYEEEFGLAQAWSWSPDSKHIAYWQTDERDVHIFQMTDYSGHHPEYEKIPYPQVSDENPKIKIGVVNVENGTQQWMDLPIGDGYIPR
ncbi:MAG: DPP IV N-terminal domain-containing protein, partial [Balneolaceae bacterium]|nr:DPP IV N-terminal domain-containing protein [Balneolaceae bacterium]